MKKVVAVAAFAAVAAAASLSFGGMLAGTGVNGSFHDMNDYNQTINGIKQRGNQDMYNRVCVFCHTPHNATVNDGNMLPLPLWGNAITGKSQTPYQWATPLNSTLVQDPLVGPSRLCMTCHDGTLAVDAHTSNGTDNNGNYTLSKSRAIGSDDSPLTQTHPIGFDYVAAKNARNHPLVKGVTQTVKEIVDEQEAFATDIATDGAVQGVYNNVTRGGNRTIDSVLYRGLNGGKIMTCATCHEVHNKENVAQEAALAGATTYPNYFLYAKEYKSLICLSCHIK